MANIVLIYTGFEYSGNYYPHAFHEGLENTLVRENNNVLRIISNDILNEPWADDSLKDSINRKSLSEKLQSFSADLIISINYAVPAEILDLTDCPVAVYTADSPFTYYVNKNVYQRHKDRYYFLCVSKSIVRMVKKVFDPDSGRIANVKFATDFAAEDLIQDTNVVFIGSHWSQSYYAYEKSMMTEYCHDYHRKDLKKIVEILEQKPDQHADEIYKLAGINIENHIYKPDINALLRLIAGSKRISILNEVSKLNGFELYGSKEWNDAISFSLSIFLSYNDKTVFSLPNLQALYNRSKLTLSTSHTQTSDAVPWRIRDVMATNSIIVSDARSELKHEFPGINFPTYESAYEARELCQKLLNDGIWRQELSAQCQEEINRGHRFEHRLKDIQQIIGIPLMNKDSETQTIGHGILTNLFTVDNIQGNKYISSIFVNAVRYVLRIIIKIMKVFYRMLPQKIKTEIRQGILK